MLTRRQSHPMWRSHTVVVLAALLASACARSSRPFPVDPDASFALHQVGERLVIDRLPSGRDARLETRGTFAGGTSSFVLRSDQDVLGALWTVGRSRVIARETTSSLSPGAGEVVAAWEDGTIHLTLYLRSKRVLHTEALARQSGTGPATLDRNARTAPDVRGTYRAVVTDGDGKPVGWVRIRLDLDGDESAPRLYDGVLPADVSDLLAVAVAVLLDGEIGWFVSRLD